MDVVIKSAEALLLSWAMDMYVTNSDMILFLCEAGHNDLVMII